MITLHEARASGKPIRFKAGNTVAYFQDFGWWRTLPTDRTFYDVGDAPHGWRTLVSSGYGVKDCYGNGSIFIDPKQLTSDQLEPAA